VDAFAAACNIYAYDAVDAGPAVSAPGFSVDVFDVGVPARLLPDEAALVPPLSPPPPHALSNAMLVIKAEVEIFLIMLIHLLLCAA
jgi:hypothetical protein